MEPVKPAKEGKLYRGIDGPAKDQVGVCIEAWETAFGHKFLKIKNETGIYSARAGDVERVKRRSKR